MQTDRFTKLHSWNVWVCRLLHFSGNTKPWTHYHYYNWEILLFLILWLLCLPQSFISDLARPLVMSVALKWRSKRWLWGWRSVLQACLSTGKSDWEQEQAEGRSGSLLQRGRCSSHSEEGRGKGQEVKLTALSSHAHTGATVKLLFANNDFLAQTLHRWRGYYLSTSDLMGWFLPFFYSYYILCTYSIRKLVYSSLLYLSW